MSSTNFRTSFEIHVAVCVCKIIFNFVKVYTCCCKIFRGLTVFWTQCMCMYVARRGETCKSPDGFTSLRGSISPSPTPDLGLHVPISRTRYFSRVCAALRRSVYVRVRLCVRCLAASSQSSLALDEAPHYCQLITKRLRSRV